MKYDLVGKLVEETKLTRKDIIAILRGIQKPVFEQFKDNPEEFIIKAAALINDEKATAIIQHITYDVLDERYGTEVFTDPTIRGKLGVNAMKAKKHLYDHVVFDSTNERDFAAELDTNTDVAVYVKLPDGFYISTPVGHYNPDWAIAFYEGKVKHIYFVAETKIKTAEREHRYVPDIDLSPYYVYREEESQNSVVPYTKEDFLGEVYMSEESYDTLVALLKNKKNLILQGAPGVGKTFAAKRLAYSLIGEKDDSRIEFIQFHQNYSYEDFIMGYKPQEQGFKLTNGIFYRFCMTAADHPEKDYYFIIDEINRGNMSKIFGELLMLIEKDYRGTKATLAYSSTTFSVPKNLYMIGMMNTADRSLAMIDYALRRRFSFYEMEPGFHSEGFKAYQASLQNETFNVLIEQIVELNREINADDSLGAGFRIGHSYFCGQKECTEEWMKSVVYYDIIPMLQEYWFDDRQKVQRWENLLIGVFND